MNAAGGRWGPLISARIENRGEKDEWGSLFLAGGNLRSQGEGKPGEFGARTNQGILRLAVTAESPNDAEGRGWESRGVDSGRARVRAFPRARSSRRAAARRGGGAGRGAGRPSQTRLSEGGPAQKRRKQNGGNFQGKKKKCCCCCFNLKDCSLFWDIFKLFFMGTLVNKI